MKYLIFSDVHSNLSALKKLFASECYRIADRRICLGDVTGYGAFPSECLKKIKESVDACLMGNHESGLIDSSKDYEFGYFAMIALRWTRKRLNDAERDYIRSLPIQISEEDLYFVHGTPYKPEKFYYLYMFDNDTLFASFDFRICFCGHTHQPLVIEESGYHLHGNYLELKENSRYIINVGSVGQPRDRDNRGCAVLYDTGNQVLQFYRFEYDIDKEARAIRDAHLPDFLASRLYYGE